MRKGPALRGAFFVNFRRMGMPDGVSPLSRLPIVLDTKEGTCSRAVFDCDFLHDDIEKVAQANIIATIVDGEEVYRAVT